MKQKQLSRRTMLKNTATALAAAPALHLTSAAQPANKKGGGRFFTAIEWRIVDELTEIIIPADEHSPGARAAKVVEYIDARLAEAVSDAPRQQWRAGIRRIEMLAREMFGKPFLRVAAPQCYALVERIAQNEAEPQKDEEQFFVEVKSRTARAYYTSKIGLQQELEYKGNVYLKEYVGIAVN